jgi:CPA2 family monovalent cation:H+ antiporter-2
VTGHSPRRSVNAGAALVARGEFTIILSQLAVAGVGLDAGFRERIGPFAGLFVVATTVAGVLFMRESRRIGRRLFASPARATKVRKADERSA